MRVTLDAPLVCPITVGREPQLAGMERLLGQAAAGHGVTALITGEAGIGKSRLVAETRALAVHAGVAVLEGHAFEGDHATPFAPVVDLLQRYLNAHAPQAAAAVLGPAAPGLARLLPAVAAWLPEGRGQANDNQDYQQQRLFQSLLLGLDRLIEQQPTLVIVEDIHWSDEASLDLLRQLARSAPSRRLLLVLTLRSEEVSEGVAELRSTLDRQRLAVELPLGPLSRTEVDAVVHAIVGSSVRMQSDALATITELSEGNPFFVEEVLRTLVGSGDALANTEVLRAPRSVRDAVQRRVHRLSEPARQTLRLAAAAGRRFDFALLAELLQVDERSVLAVARELVGAQLLVEVGEDHLAFRHALTRQAVYADLLGRERRALHLQVLRILQRRGESNADTHIEALSYHAHAACEWKSAIDYCARAGTRALALHAPRAAVEHFERAFQAAHELHEPLPLDVVRGRGQAYDVLGNFDRALTDYEAVLERAAAAKDQLVMWQVLVDLSLLWSRHDYARAGGYARHSLEVARQLDRPTCVGHSLNRVGNWHLNVGRVREALDHQQAALRMFESSGDERGVAESLHLLGMTSAFVDSELSASYYDRALPMLRRLDERQGLVTDLVMRSIQSGFYWADTLAPAERDREQADRDSDEALRLAREMHWHAGEAFALWELALWLGPRGEYRRALQFARAGLTIAEEIEHRQWIAGALCSLGVLYLDVLNPTLARAAVERALTLARELGSAVWIPYAAACLARALLQQGNLPGARRVLDEAVGADAGYESITDRQLWCARAELAMAQSAWPEAVTILDRLSATLPARRVAPRLWTLRGEALAASGSVDEAERAFGAAMREATERGLTSQMWRAEAALARLLRRRNRRDEADRLIAAARSRIDRLAAELDETEIREAFVANALQQVPRAGASKLRAQRLHFDGLTAREWEVARLIAVGKPNRAIAADLVVSERTVETYVSNIFAKLGFSSRTQLAAWAVTRSGGTESLAATQAPWRRASKSP